MTMTTTPASDNAAFVAVDMLPAFMDISLLLARAETDDDLRTALAVAARRLGAFLACPVSICELGLSPAGRPVILWQSPAGLAIDVDGDFADWYARATRPAQTPTPVRGARWRGLLSSRELSGDIGLRVAIVLAAGEETGGLAAHIHALADLAVAAAMRIRAQKTMALERKRLDEMNVAARAWIELGADIAWEASADGILRCRRIFNRRSDIARALDGTHLERLRVGDDGQSLLDAMRDQGSVRYMRVRLPDDAARQLPDGETLCVSGRLRAADDPGFAGIFAAVDSKASSPHARDAAMLVQMHSARMREEQQRREAEAMLQGLRLLLAQSSSAEKMEQLVALVCACIGADDACVLERGFDGKTRLVVPRQRALPPGTGAVLGAVLENAPHGNVVVFNVGENEGGRLADILDLDGTQIAVLSLPLRGDAAFVACATRRPQGFASIDLDFAERFTLLLRQAMFLREEQSQLAHSAKMAALGQMSASIAHELRQPLNTISLAVQNLEFILDAPEIDSDAASKKVKRVLAQIDRASEVIDRMRRFGRKSIGENEPLVLRDAVSNVEALMRHVLLSGGVLLEVDVPPEIEVFADQLQLEQVLGNLIQNAVDAIAGIGTARGNEKGAIRVAAAPSPEEKGTITLRVEDNGSGFDPDIIERVLKPFFTTKPMDSGTGLGLAICDAIVREFGGRIEVGNHASGGYVEILLRGKGG